jgi:hypothetical protein
MSDSELAVVSVDSFSAPALIARAGPTTRKKFFEFFTVPIRNANTRAAYYRNCGRTSRPSRKCDSPAAPKRRLMLCSEIQRAESRIGHLIREKADGLISPF